MQASMLTRSVSKWQDIQIEGSESEGELGGGGTRAWKRVCVCVLWSIFECPMNECSTFFIMYDKGGKGVHSWF